MARGPKELLPTCHCLLELALGHARAPLDVQVLGAPVELFPRAAFDVHAPIGLAVVLASARVLGARVGRPLAVLGHPAIAALLERCASAPSTRRDARAGPRRTSRRHCRAPWPTCAAPCSTSAATGRAARSSWACRSSWSWAWPHLHNSTDTNRLPRRASVRTTHRTTRRTEALDLRLRSAASTTTFALSV
jgi:hypothetical protein